MFVVRMYRFGKFHVVLCFYDPVFKHISIVGPLPLCLENKEKNVRERVRRNESVTEQKSETERYFIGAPGCKSQMTSKENGFCNLIICH